MQCTISLNLNVLDKNIMKKTVTFTLIMIQTLLAFSQNNNIKIKLDNNGKVKYAKFPITEHNNQKKSEKLITVESFLQEYLDLNSNDKFVKVYQRQKEQSSRNEHYDQYYNNIKVENGGYNFHFENNKLRLAHGKYILITDIKTEPVIGTEEAMQIWAAYKDIPEEIITDYKSQLLIKAISTSGNKTITSNQLVYRVYLNIFHPNNNEIAYIDAIKGSVVLTEPSIINFSATGTFATRYNGTRQAQTYYDNGDYILYDDTRGATIHTRDMNDFEYFNSLTELTDTDNNWTFAEYNPNNDDMGLDIHWSLQEIYDYMTTTHNRKSYDDDDFPIEAYFHYGSTDIKKDNAGWSPSGDYLVFGEGAVKFRPIASIDAVAHEYGHGITDFQIGWENTDDEQSLSEGVSDIWAVILENAISSTPNWTIGEQIDLSFSYIRNIETTLDPNARMQIANTYLDATYNDNSDISMIPYIKGGVISHWFYLLVNGGSGTNGIGNPYNVYGIGIEAAEKLIVNSVYENYLDNTSIYPEVSTNIIDASESSALFGINSFHALQVKNAWYAVGLGTESNQPIISGSNTVCFSGSNFLLINAPIGSEIDWTTSSNLTITSGQNTSNINARAARIFSSGPGWVQANFTSNGYTAAGPRINVWVGKPAIPTTMPSGYPTVEIPLESYLYIALTNSSGAEPNTTTWWSTGSIEIDNASQTGCTFHAYDTGIGNFYVTTENSCGISSIGGGTVNVYSGGGGELGPISLSVMPNPASKYIDVEIINLDKNVENTEFHAFLFNNQNIPVYSNKSYFKKFKIETGKFPRGLYILLVIYNGKNLSKQIIIEH